MTETQDERCGAIEWVAGQDTTNPHLIKPRYRCSDAAGHEGVIHKHGGYIWLADGDHNHESTQMAERSFPDTEQHVDALDMAIQHLAAAEMALQWGCQKDGASNAAISKAVEDVRRRRNEALGYIHDRERRAAAAS